MKLSVKIIHSPDINDSKRPRLTNFRVSVLSLNIPNGSIVLNAPRKNEEYTKLEEFMPYICPLAESSGSTGMTAFESPIMTKTDEYIKNLSLSIIADNIMESRYVFVSGCDNF